MSNIIIALKNIFNFILSVKNISFYQNISSRISLMGVAVTPSENSFYIFLILIVSVCLLLYIYINSESILIISLSIILVLTLISINFPMLSFLLMLFISAFLLIIVFPYNIYHDFFNKRQKLLKSLLHYLKKIDFLDFLAVIHIKFFAVPKNILNLRLVIIFILSLLYIFSSRYYFYQVTILKNDLPLWTYFLISLLLFLGIMTSYFRFLITISLSILPLVLRTEPSLLNPDVLYILDEDPNSTPPPSDSAKQRFSLININYTKQHFHHTSPNNFRRLGLCLGFCTFVVGSFAAYYTKAQADHAKVQADYAKVQADEARRQSYHTAREADVAAVEANLITKEEYYRRHPQDKPK